MITYRMATEADRSAVESLWSYSFEPAGSPFFEYYFQHVYRPEDTLVAVWDDTVVANVHLRPYRIAWGRGGRYVEPVSYLVGVTTHPAYRNRRLGRGMLCATIQTVAARGEKISILMPSYAGFYQPLGWELYCHQWECRMRLATLKARGSMSCRWEMVTDSDGWPWLASVYDAFTAQRFGYAMRDEAQWRLWMESLFAEGMRIVVAFEENTPVGYLVYRLGEPEIYCSEFVYSTRAGQRALWGFLGQHQSQGTEARWNEWMGDSGYRFDPDGKGTRQTMPFMMARITDPIVALTGYPVGGRHQTTGGALASTMHAPSTSSVCVQEVHTRLVASPLPEGEQPTEDIGVKGLLCTLHDPLVASYSGVYHIEEREGHLYMERLASTLEEVELGALHDRLGFVPTEVHIDIGALSLLYLGVSCVEELLYEGRLTAEEAGCDLLQRWFPPAQEPSFINEWY